MEQPLISVVIPVYNAEKYVAEAINSLLAQNYPNLEIIVVNDGSTDNSFAVLQSFGNKIEIISQTNKGQAVARNVGLRKARGSIIGMLDADDMWPKDHIAIMLPYLLGENSYDVVRGLTKYVKDIGTDDEMHTKPLFMEALVGSCLYKKSLFAVVGLFDEEMRQGEDFDWNIRLNESRLKEKRLEMTTLLYRRHQNNLTNDQAFVANGQFNAFRKKIARTKAKKTS